VSRLERCHCNLKSLILRKEWVQVLVSIAMVMICCVCKIYIYIYINSHTFCQAYVFEHITMTKITLGFKHYINSTYKV